MSSTKGTFVQSQTVPLHAIPRRSYLYLIPELCIESKNKQLAQASLAVTKLPTSKLLMASCAASLSGITSNLQAVRFRFSPLRFWVNTFVLLPSYMYAVLSAVFLLQAYPEASPVDSLFLKRGRALTYCA